MPTSARIVPRGLGSILACSLAALGCADASRAEAEAAATGWAAQHSAGWNLEIASASPADAFVPGPGQPPCQNDRFWVRSSTRTAEIDMWFNCPDVVVDFDWLKGNLRDYGVGFIPVGIDAPGWRFHAVPPSSSLTAGLTLESWTREQLALRIETALYAIVGESRSSECVQASQIADGGNEDCFVTVPFAGPLIVTMNVPLPSSTFLAAIPPRP